MTGRLALTWLAYLTKENYSKRFSIVEQSIKSLRNFSRNDVSLILIDNSEIDNYETIRLRDSWLPNTPVFKACNQFCDVAAHYTSLFAAEGLLIGYTYDDFVFYDWSWVQATNDFMTINAEVACCRISKFNTAEMNRYNAEITPKDINPEAVRFSNTYRNSKLEIIGTANLGDYSFGVCNWRPISKPTIWNVEKFVQIIGTPSPCPTLQQFEQYMYDKCDAAEVWHSSFLDKGACHTFPQNTSVRIKNGLGISKPSPVADISALNEALNDKSRWW